MPLISVVIVNYNVKYFIRQCLQSLFQSSLSDQLEIIVVDNDSKDGSVEMISKLFPAVTIIANDSNLGFGKANNQGIKIAKGEYILILNPDTLVEEKTLEKCLDFAKLNKDVGAICVPMIDGSGHYLPESKRGFPTPLRSFFKLTGLSKLFPNSQFFNGYYLGQLDPDSINDIDVLTGAFAFIRADVLKEVDGFDEDYFMYGEDIELSYQIKQSGSRIVYFPESQIIHFKGESTNKSSLNYLRNFYGAMHIYANKRGKGSGFLWNSILKTGIIFTAIAGFFRSITQKFIRPALDFLLLLGFGFLFQYFWATYYHNNSNYYNLELLTYVLAVISFILVFSYYIFGQYDRRHNLRHLFYGFASATLLNLSLYSLLPIEFRFSRVILLAIVLFSPFLLFVTRKFYNYIFNGVSSFDRLFNKRVAIIGAKSSCEKISQIVNTFSEKSNIVGNILTDQELNSLGPVENIEDVVHSRDINELVFCSKDLTSEYIFATMSGLGRMITYKIANDDNSGILGSDSKNKIGEWYTLDIGFKIDQVFHRRTKRFLDIGIALSSIVLLPVIVLFAKQKLHVLRNIIPVLLNKKTWISYVKTDRRAAELPSTKEGVFELLNRKSEALTSSNQDIHQINLYYARNYSIWTDMQMFFQSIF